MGRFWNKWGDFETNGTVLKQMGRFLKPIQKDAEGGVKKTMCGKNNRWGAQKFWPLVFCNLVIILRLSCNKVSRNCFFLSSFHKEFRSNKVHPQRKRKMQNVHQWKQCLQQAEGTVQLQSIFHVPFPMHSYIFICCLIAFPLWIIVPLTNPNHFNDASGKRHSQSGTNKTSQFHSSHLIYFHNFIAFFGITVLPISYSHT